MAVSVRAKLFLALLLASVLAVAGTSAFVRWSVQQGLSELADARENERIEMIAERLVERHREDGSWDRLAGDKGLWVRTLLGRDRLGRWRDPARQRSARWLKHRLGEPGVWPPRPPRGPNPDWDPDWDPNRAHGRDLDPHRPPRLAFRLMLLDADGGILYGRESLLPGTRRIALMQDGERIGTLAVIPGRPAAELPELRFQSRQLTRLGLIALGMITLSALIAYVLSRRLVRPLRAFQGAARRLADGDYSARVETPGNDEVASLGRDIDALAAALERNEQARRRWMADISHELRTPVALLRAELEAIQDGVRPLERRSVDALHGDVLRLARLVDDLGELTLTDLGALSYRMAPGDPGEVLADEIEAFRPRFEAAGLGLDLEDRRGTPAPCRIDPHRLGQLFRNLLRNSLQYTDPGGALRVILDQGADKVTVDFRDTAPGVPGEALPRLFERLYRVEGSRSRHTGGAGLGLAIARNIAEAHGGRIAARAAPEGGLWIRLEIGCGA